MKENPQPLRDKKTDSGSPEEKQTAHSLNDKKGLFKWSGPLLLILSFALMTLLVYVGSRPKTYNLHVSDASPYDIEAPRSIVNYAETHRRATEAAALVPNKMTQSQEVSDRSLGRTRSFLEIVSARRKQLYRLQNDGPEEGDYRPSNSEVMAATTGLLAEISEKLEKEADLQLILDILQMSNERFAVFSNNVRSSADVIMRQPLDELSIGENIREEVETIYKNESFYRNDKNLAVQLLGVLLEPNVIFNQDATENARQDAFNNVQQNPIMINRGTRIVSEGDIITDETYALLMGLNLIDAENIDYQILGGQALLLLILYSLAIIYLRFAQPQLLGFNREMLTLVISLLIPMAFSAYLGQSMQLSPPVYFSSVLISAYFGFETSLVMSALLIVAVMPMVNFNPAFLLVAILGCAVAALFTQNITRQDNFAKLILAISCVNFMSSTAYSFMQRTTAASFGVAVASSVLSGASSVIAAIGLMPLFEMIFNTVSPLRLIELSQPGQPLMRRLFVEAPGTSQHSMMVANLADTAAEAVGANAMICRVGAYYHDIGKLENPLMFTENQQGYNPHDYLTPEESTRIITRHPEDSYKLGKRLNLPMPVLRIALEHHGSTVLQYFYHKAKAEAEREGRPDPNPDLYRYHTPLPSSRESAIVMLADSTEAAVKSSGSTNLKEAEEVMRNVLKIKNEQNQFKNSGLSYADVEKIMQAFLQVYAGHFHERIKYPDADSSRDNQ